MRLSHGGTCGGKSQLTEAQIVAIVRESEVEGVTFEQCAKRR